MAAIQISLTYHPEHSDPTVTVQIPLANITNIFLSVANRMARNRSALYQQKHVPGIAAGTATRERHFQLASLNYDITTHYEVFLASRKLTKEQAPAVLGFGIGDLTANPLRPHYDTTVKSQERAFRCAEIDRILFGTSPPALFHLEDEPLGQVPYTLLLAYQQQGRCYFSIRHQVQVRPDGGLPEEQVPAEIVQGLLWWAACPPLLIHGHHDLSRYAVLDYDLRHVFGFPWARRTTAQREAQRQQLQEIHRLFPNWPAWTQAIQAKLQDLSSSDPGYHAALGLSDDQLFLVHRNATISALAEELKQLGIQEAVLLDSGGSCAIWSNWLNGNQGALLASHWNFRPARGTMVFLQLEQQRYPVPPNNPS